MGGIKVITGFDWQLELTDYQVTVSLSQDAGRFGTHLAATDPLDP